MERLNISVVAVTVDDRASTEAMAREYGLTFNIAYGLGSSQLEEFDPWWVDDDHGHYPQPMEFLIIRRGTVVGSMYASGPIGRMDVDQVLMFIEGRERRRTQPREGIR